MPLYLAFHPSPKNKIIRQIITWLPPWSPNEVMLMAVDLVALRSAAAKASVVGTLVVAAAAGARTRSQSL